MTFHVGQKVVLVDASHIYCECLRKGHVYRILAKDPGFLCVDCCAEHAEDCHWLQTRFRPIVERKTDISIFTEILTRTGVDA